MKIKTFSNIHRYPVNDSKTGLSEYKTRYMTSTGRLQPMFIDTDVIVFILLRRTS